MRSGAPNLALRLGTAASAKAVVLRLKLPVIARASIAGEELRCDRTSADAEWRDGQLFLEGRRFGPIPFHEEDAEGVAGLLAC